MVTRLGTAEHRANDANQNRRQCSRHLDETCDEHGDETTVTDDQFQHNFKNVKSCHDFFRFTSLMVVRRNSALFSDFVF